MTAETPCKTWLALVADDDAAASLHAGLWGCGAEVRRWPVGTDLVQPSPSHAPEAVIWHLGLHDRADPGPTVALPDDWDVPLLLVGHGCGAPPHGLDTWLAASGAHHWLPSAAAMTPTDWHLALAFARASHGRDRSQRQHIASLQGQLAEQRVVARAKGLLMAAQGMSEDGAFAFLRSGAMQTRLPLAGMARAVVNAAVWSEAVNRAGQLRWLSQRCITAAAQRLARIDPPAARRMQNDALKRARDIVDGLARLPVPEATRQALDDTDQAWHALRACLDERLDLGSLSRADAAAELALARAEALTGGLQALGSTPLVRVVNLCGRQRMRAQRVVKLGLLDRLGVARPGNGNPPGAAHAGHAAEAAALVTAFSNTLVELAALPLGSTEIAAAYQLAADRWGDMVRALQAGEPAPLVHCGEAVLVSVDALTRCWERSLQLLLG